MTVRPMIFKPGKYLDAEAELYHEDGALGSTMIRIAAQWCVAFCLVAFKKESPALRRGTLDHIAILEPDRLERDFVVAEIQRCAATKKGDGAQCTRNSVPGASTCKQHGGERELEEWLAGLGDGVELITSEEMERAKCVGVGVKDALSRTGQGWLLSDKAEREVSYFANAVLTDDGYEITMDDVDSAIPVKSRTDIRATRLICDLKGKARKEALLPRKWAWEIEDYGCHIQGRLYSDVVACVEQEERTEFGWLVHMTEDPFAVRLFTMSDTDRMLGGRAVREGLRRWKHYFDTGDPWLGWPTGLEEVTRPHFIIEREIEE